MSQKSSKIAYAKAFGSVLDLLPSGSYAKHMPQGTAASRINAHFNHAGQHLASAVLKASASGLQPGKSEYGSRKK